MFRIPAELVKSDNHDIPAMVKKEVKTSDNPILFSSANMKYSQAPHILSKSERKLEELKQKYSLKTGYESVRQKKLLNILSQFIDKSLPYIDKHNTLKQMDYEMFYMSFMGLISFIDTLSDTEYKKAVKIAEDSLKYAGRDNISRIHEKIDNILELYGDRNVFNSTAGEAIGGKEQQVKDTQSRFQNILNNEGIISDLINMSKIGTTRDNVNHSISSAFSDINKLKKLAKSDPIEFMELYRLMFGVPFRVENFETLKKDKENFAKAQVGELAKNSRNILSDAREKDERAGIFSYFDSDNISPFNKNPLQKALLNYFNNDKEKVVNWLKTRREKLDIQNLSPAERYNKLEKQFADEMSAIEKYSLNGKSFDYYEDKYKNSLKEAFGKNVPEEKLNSYVSTQKYTKGAIELGVAALTGGSSLAGFAIATGVTSATMNTVDQATSKNGITAGQCLEFLADAALEATIAYGAGKTLEWGASKVLSKLKGQKLPAKSGGARTPKPERPVVTAPAAKTSTISADLRKTLENLKNPQILKYAEETAKLRGSETVEKLVQAYGSKPERLLAQLKRAASKKVKVSLDNPYAKEHVNTINGFNKNGINGGHNSDIYFGKDGIFTKVSKSSEPVDITSSISKLNSGKKNITKVLAEKDATDANSVILKIFDDKGGTEYLKLTHDNSKGVLRQQWGKMEDGKMIWKAIQPKSVIAKDDLEHLLAYNGDAAVHPINFDRKLSNKDIVGNSGAIKYKNQYYKIGRADDGTVITIHPVSQEQLTQLGFEIDSIPIIE